MAIKKESTLYIFLMSILLNVGWVIALLPLFDDKKEWMIYGGTLMYAVGIILLFSTNLPRDIYAKKITRMLRWVYGLLLVFVSYYCTHELLLRYVPQLYNLKATAFYASAMLDAIVIFSIIWFSKDESPVHKK